MEKKNKKSKLNSLIKRVADNHSRIIAEICILVFIVILFGLLIIFLQLLTKLSVDALKAMFGDGTVALLVVYLIVAVFIVGLYFFLMMFLDKLMHNKNTRKFLIVGISMFLHNFMHSKDREFNRWFHLTLATGIVMLLLGIHSINLILSVPDLDSILKDMDDDDKITGEIDCAAESREFLEGKSITCKIIKPELSDFNWSVVLTDIEGSKTLFNQTLLSTPNHIEFEALKDTKYVYFEIHGISDDQETYNLHVGRSFEFITPSKLAEVKEKRLTYVLSLIFVILFSVPSSMVAFRNLWRDKS